MTIRTEQAAACLEIVGRAVEIGGGSSPTPGVAVAVDHRVGEGGVGVEEGRHTRPDVCADMASLPFRDGSFDTLIAVHLLEHHPDTLRVLAEWLRVAPRLVIVCPDQETYDGNTVALDPTHQACFTPAQLHALCAHMGAFGDFRPLIPQWSFLLVAARHHPCDSKLASPA